MVSELQPTLAASGFQRQRGDNEVDDSKARIAWAISPHVRSTIDADGGVLLDIEKGLCYSLNIAGAKIWKAIESGAGEATFTDIVALLADQFTVPPEQLAQDVDEYLQDLEKKGLIKAVSRV